MIDICFTQSFCILSVDKSFETVPKHNGAAFISESFVLNSYISTLLTNE